MNWRQHDQQTFERRYEKKRGPGRRIRSVSQRAIKREKKNPGFPSDLHTLYVYLLIPNRRGPWKKKKKRQQTPRLDPARPRSSRDGRMVKDWRAKNKRGGARVAPAVGCWEIRPTVGGGEWGGVDRGARLNLRRPKNEIRGALTPLGHIPKYRICLRFFFAPFSRT